MNLSRKNILTKLNILFFIKKYIVFSFNNIDFNFYIFISLPTIFFRKQVSIWSSTIPTACIKAYIIVDPTNDIPLFLRSLEIFFEISDSETKSLRDWGWLITGNIWLYLSLRAGEAIQSLSGIPFCFSGSLRSSRWQKPEFHK